MASLYYKNILNFMSEDDLAGLQVYLENKRVILDDKDDNGATALHYAATKGKLEFVKVLLNHNADVNAEDQDNWSPLLCAAKEGYTEVCQELLDREANIEHRDMGGWSALMWASYKGHTPLALMLLERGADVNAHGNFHISSLLWASGRGHALIAKALLSHGAKANVGDKYGTTALVWAARRGNLEIVNSLLKFGANVDTAGMHSWTPLLVASMGNHSDVVLCLLECRPNVNAMDKDGSTALMIACREGYTEVASALIAAGAYINIQDRSGDTNLIHAVKGGHRSAIDALLKKYADVDIPGKERKTATYTAVEKGNIPILKMLLSANPDLEIPTKDGDTALLKAVRSRNVEAVQLLLERKAKVSAADKWGDTALHIAMRARSKAIVEVLLRNPKNSQLLYRPNRSGETPYNIDIASPKTILGQIFGARRINTNEDNENMLGYDLYSSALADMLSEPSLSMPITVGLYAKWGSGKSFLLGKLREEMKSFARQWTEPLVHFSWVLLVILAHCWLIVSLIGGLAAHSWPIGIIVFSCLALLSYITFVLLFYSSKRYNWDLPYNLSIWLTSRMNAVKVVLQVMFCHPPGGQWSDSIQALPIRFYFTEQTRVGTTTAGENSIVQMIGSLYDSIESDYGLFATRLFRAFRPKAIKSCNSWKWRRLCCLPNFLIFEVCFAAILVIIGLLAISINEADLSPEEKSIDNMTRNIVIGLSSGLVVMCATANAYTLARIARSLVSSQRRHVRRALASLETVKSEGFLQALRGEVSLMTDMVKCLDAFTGQQTRLVVIVDGLDSCEQDKVLLILDAVHALFSGVNSPFIIILAIDPHVISKAVEANGRRLLSESNIGGHDFLRNMVHLPFYLQNSGLRKVKVAQRAAIRKGYSSSDLTVIQPMRRSSNDVSQQKELKVPGRKQSRKLKLSESIASSLGSNLNRAGGPHDLTKMLLTDDYFSDVNPRSMRRLMNVVYITGRLLKAFQMDFNWYHLASWVNITEQWPYRTSWIIYYLEVSEEHIDDGISLKALYDKVRREIPVLKEVEPLLDLDRDERKLDVFLSFHRSSLLVADLRIFLPFTINLDPYIKKVIKDDKSHGEEALAMTGFGTVPGWEPVAGATWASPAPVKPPTLRKQRSGSLHPREDGGDRSGLYTVRVPVVAQAAPPQQPPPLWSQAVLHQQPPPLWPQAGWLSPTSLGRPVHQPPIQLPVELDEIRLSGLNVSGVCQLLSKVPDLSQANLPRYISLLQKNNINGKVLKNCDQDELKRVLKMNFGDWEMFRIVLNALRSADDASQSRVRFGSGPPSPQQPPPPPLGSSSSGGGVSVGGGSKDSRPSSSSYAAEDSRFTTAKERANSMEKQYQVTLEEQMICGALQTLNEEACEDVLEEGGDNLSSDFREDKLKRAGSEASCLGGTATSEEAEVIILQNWYGGGGATGGGGWTAGGIGGGAGIGAAVPGGTDTEVSYVEESSTDLDPPHPSIPESGSDADSRPSSLILVHGGHRGSSLSARRSLSVDAEPQVWRRPPYEGASDDENTPLVGTSPLTPIIATRPIIITHQPSITSDPETTL